MKNVITRLLTREKQHRNLLKQEPRIIARNEHGINREQICRHALWVIQRLREAGYCAYLVGGGVRDLLMGRNPKDFDIATSAHPEEVKALFAHSRLIGRRFRIVHVYFGRYVIEVATFRGQGNGNTDGGERHIEDGRLVRDNVFGSEGEDALRRDFTINALMYNPQEESVRDYVNGYADIRAGVLRMIGDPETRYREDPVRMIRAIRFCSSRALMMASETAAPIRALVPLLRDVSPARLFEEVCKVFLSGHGSNALPLMAEYGLFQELFPDSLSHDENGWHGDAVLTQALINTDQRVAQDKPVTPGFLMAALLWQPLQQQIQALEHEGLEGMDAISEAIDIVLEEQTQIVAIPRRFTAIAREIWMMQPRFRRMRGKRVLRLLAERRFRAAYDFLLLRALEHPELDSVAQWWTEIQEVPPAEQEKRVVANAPASRHNRRRRRRRGNQRRSADNATE